MHFTSVQLQTIHILFQKTFYGIVSYEFSRFHGLVMPINLFLSYIFKHELGMTLRTNFSVFKFIHVYYVNSCMDSMCVKLP